VVVRDGEYELAIVAEAIHGMINYEKLLGSDTTRPANLPTFVREEFEWQENRVCFLDISRLVATTARLAGIATNPDQGDL
jgi:chemotaxis signal transduction protein